MLAFEKFSATSDAGGLVRAQWRCHIDVLMKLTTNNKSTDTFNAIHSLQHSIAGSKRRCTSNIHAASQRGSRLHLALHFARNLVVAETATHQQTKHITFHTQHSSTITAPRTNHHSRQHAGANNSLQGSQLAVRQRLGNLHRTHVRNLVVPETATHQQTKHITFHTNHPSTQHRTAHKPQEQAARGSEQLTPR